MPRSSAEIRKLKAEQKLSDKAWVIQRKKLEKAEAKLEKVRLFGPPAVTDEERKEMLYNMERVKRHIPFDIWDKIRTLILAPPVVKNTTVVAENTTPKKVSRADIREWVRAMANVVDEHRDILQDRYLMMCEANENYLRDKLRELGIEVEE